MIDVSKVYKSKSCGDFMITKYISCSLVKVRFLSTGYETTTQSSNIRSGSVKDRFHPTVFGVGFLGRGKNKASNKGVTTKAYRVWQSMLGRCYDRSIQLKHPTYTECSVCDEWHNFQTFADWFCENSVIDFHLDKDIKNKGNKIYSPSNCMFVTRKENNIKARAKNYSFKSPYGLHIKVYNLSEFCKINNLHCSNMVQVSNGNRVSHKGWTL